MTEITAAATRAEEVKIVTFILEIGLNLLGREES
jgi:hypothetical protein